MLMLSVPRRRARTIPVIAALAATVALSACGTRHHLDDYEFARRSLAVVHYGEPVPELRTGNYRVDTQDPLSAVVSAGGRVAKVAEGRRARARLDSAAHRMAFATRVAERTAERAGRYLGTRAIAESDAADFLLEIDLHRLGLDASGDRIHLFVTGEAILLDATSGREIWAARIAGHDPMSPDLVDDPLLEDVLGAGALLTMSTDDFEAVLWRLTEYASDRVVRKLRSDLRDVRD